MPKFIVKGGYISHGAPGGKKSDVKVYAPGDMIELTIEEARPIRHHLMTTEEAKLKKIIEKQRKEAEATLAALDNAEKADANLDEEEETKA